MRNVIEEAANCSQMVQAMASEQLSPSQQVEGESGLKGGSLQLVCDC